MSNQEKTTGSGTEIVQSMVQIKGALKNLMKSGLNKRAIVVLIQDRTRLPKATIENVLDTLCKLETWYTIKQ